MTRMAVVSTALVIFLSVLSCSNDRISNPGPMLPEITSQTENQASYGGESVTGQSESSHGLWAFYTAYVDPQANEIEMIPLRSVTTHWNAVKWLEYGPCTDCVKVVSFTDSGSGTKLIDVEISHPFSNSNFTGFDVRGITIFNSGLWFPETMLSIADHVLGNGEMVDPDGYTALYNVNTYGSGPGGLQGYIKAKYGTQTSPYAFLNGYHRFISQDAANTRNAFYAGDSITRTYELYMPTNPFIFNYAVDASWAPPITKPVTDPMADFPPEANCSEPWKLVVEHENPWWLTDHGGYSGLILYVYDHQGKSSYNMPFVECPDLFDGTIKFSFLNDGPDYSRYYGEIRNDNLAPEGLYKCIIGVEDKDNATSPSYLDLTAYTVDEIRVYKAEGFANTWGGPDEDWGYDVVTDQAGYIYVAGKYYADTFAYIDFDPGIGTDYHGGTGQFDCFLEKFNPEGQYEWSVVWGGSGDDAVLDLHYDYNNFRLLLVGYFSNTVDFNPGTGTWNKASNGYRDGFISVFDLNGEFQWAETWGSAENDDEGLGVVCNWDGNSYVVGYFTSTCDFDPTSGVDNHTTGLWNTAAFLSRYSTGGFWTWTKSWGEGTLDTNACANAIAMGGNDNLYITGWYKGTVDFDIASSPDFRTSNGEEDAYINVINSSIQKIWTHTWGGSGHDFAYDVMVDHQNKVYVPGTFQDTVDFNPTLAGVDNRTSNGGFDAYVSQFDSSANYLYTLTWGGPETDRAMGIARAWGIDGIYIVGDYMQTVDLDPGPGTWNQTSNGFSDIYLSRLGTNGDFEWAAGFGGSDWDAGMGVATDIWDSAIFTGAFRETVDFDPTAGIDNHTSNGHLDIFVEKVLYDMIW